MGQMRIVSEHACEGSWCTPNQAEFTQDEKIKLEGWALFQQFRFVFSDEQQKDLDEMNLKALKKIRAARTERDKTNASTVLADPTEMIPLMDASGNAAPLQEFSLRCSVWKRCKSVTVSGICDETHTNVNENPYKYTSR